MIKIVTDSSSDLPAEVVKELGITAVPLYVRFGEEIFRERVTITDTEFYRRLIEGSVHPATIQPNPGDFIPVYEEVSKQADGIVSIHISSKLSGTLNSALQAQQMAKVSCPVEVVDSQTVSIGLGIVVIAAAKAAAAGKSMQEVMAVTQAAIESTQAQCVLDTLKFLQLGGRIGKAQALLGTMLNIKPVISVKGGEVVPVARVRSRGKGLELLVNFVKGAGHLEDVLIGYTTTLDDAAELGKSLAPLLGGRIPLVMRCGTTLGVHVGPGAVMVSLRGK